MIGQGVLDLPARGEGFPVLVGVSQDASGHALATALAITHGIGAFLPHGAVVESSFEEETLVDLFSEHTWAGAMLFLLDRAFKLLVEAGVSKEVALLELYASGELGEIGRAMATLGVWNQLKLHSHTSQFGQLTHGAQFIGADSEALMRKAIDEIRDGTFANAGPPSRPPGRPSINAYWASGCRRRSRQPSTSFSSGWAAANATVPGFATSLLLFHGLDVDLNWRRRRRPLRRRLRSSLFHVSPKSLRLIVVVADRTGARVAPRILDWRARHLDRERDFLGNAVQREVADDVKLARARRFDLLRLEGHRRILRHVEKVWRS